MKTIAVLLLLSSAAFAQTTAPVHVKATTTKDGEYKPAYTRTAPNTTERDNYSAKGNVNPYTGKEGTKEPKK